MITKDMVQLLFLQPWIALKGDVIGICLKKHPRFHFHFIPTSSSWLNLVERWFGEITRKRIRRGTFQSVDDLVKAIEDYIQINNQNPKPFIWTKLLKKLLLKLTV